MVGFFDVFKDFNVLFLSFFVFCLFVCAFFTILALRLLIGRIPLLNASFNSTNVNVSKYSCEYPLVFLI